MFFENAYEKLMGYEGGYSFHSNDRGGETYKGIARRKHPDWDGWKIIDANKPRANFPSCLDQNTSLELVIRLFYRTKFWDRISGDEVAKISLPLAGKLFDIAVNMGVIYAGLFLQESLNLLNRRGKTYADVAEDGVIGNETLSALAQLYRHEKADPTGVLLYWIRIAQGQRYKEIIRNQTDSTQEDFAFGWARRGMQ